jgi:hypothetical protein
MLFITSAGEIVTSYEIIFLRKISESKLFARTSLFFQVVIFCSLQCILLKPTANYSTFTFNPLRPSGNYMYHLL